MNLIVGEQQKIPIDLIVERKNYRKTYRKLDELAESMKKVGQLQALKVRAVGANGSTRAEVVFGHRRLRAGKIAGLEELTCDICEMSDVEVLEAQLIENEQREEVDLLEEAEGFRSLIDDHGYSPDDLAARTGKSKSQVYARLKLCALGDEGRHALAEGLLTPSTALLVARVPAPLQPDAVEALDPGIEDDGKPRDALGAREALRILQAKFMLRLSAATWDLADTELVPVAGPCTTCPKRTGNQPELFSDVRAVDSCTDPMCFAAKRDAAWLAQKAEAKKAGRKVLDDKSAKHLFPHGSPYLSRSSGYVDLDDKDFESGAGKRTFRDMLGKGLAESDITLARDESGKVHELVDAKIVKQLKPRSLEAELKNEDPKAHARAQAELTRQLEKKRAERAAVAGVVTAVVSKVGKKELDRPAWLALIDYAMGVAALERVLERRGFLAAAKDDLDKATKAFNFAIAKMALPDLRGVFVELLVTEREMGLGDADAFGRFCAALKIDVKAMVAKEAARLKTEEKPAAKAAPKKSSKAK